MPIFAMFNSENVQKDRVMSLMGHFIMSFRQLHKAVCSRTYIVMVYVSFCTMD